jgi:cobalt-zinc-cadmium resistance protein CzcA
MALSIILTMLGSLITALLILPPLASYLFKNGVRMKENKPLLWLEKKYRNILISLLNHSKKVIALSAILFIASLSLLPFIGTEFIPELEEGSLNIRVTLAPSSSLETAVEVAQILEEKLIKFPEVLFVSSRIGRAELGGDPEPVSNIELLIGLEDIKDWSSAQNRYELQNLMKKEMEIMPGLLFSFSQPIATRVDELLSGVKAQLAIKLFGPDLSILSKKGKEIETLVSNISGTSGVVLEQLGGEAQLVITPKREIIATYGLSVGAVMDLISDAIGGNVAGQVIKGNERYDIYVRLEKKYRSDEEKIANLKLTSTNGALLRLGDIAEVKILEGPSQIRRDNVQRRVVIEANVEGRDMGGLVDEIYHRIYAKINLAAGYSVVIGGQYENQKRAQERLIIVVPVSMCLIFLLLFFAFRSVKQAAMIMLNVPMALIGGIISLYLSGHYLSVPSSIGFITLFGIAILNGVVLVSAYNERLAAGLNLYDTVKEATISRLRPVLMTAMTSLLGLLPLVMATGVGSEVQKPLAIVVIGGIITCTLLTLALLPVIFKSIHK